MCLSFSDTFKRVTNVSAVNAAVGGECTHCYAYMGFNIDYILRIRNGTLQNATVTVTGLSHNRFAFTLTLSAEAKYEMERKLYTLKV